MLKFFAIIAYLGLVCAAPLDSKQSSTENDSKKTNLTENTGSDVKSVPAYTSHGDYIANRPPFSLYSVPTANRPIFSNPMIRPLISAPSSYQGLFSDAKNTHLRPQPYQAQPQLYTYPIQSYQSYPQSASYQSYPQSVYSYSSSYPSLQSYYGNSDYSGYYKDAKEQVEPEMAMQPAPATRLVIENPVATQPVNQIPAGADQQVSNLIPRDTSNYWSPIYAVPPQDNFGQIEDIRSRRDIFTDNNYNMQIQPPSYLMNRLRTPTYKAGRSAEDLAFSEFGPPAGPDDDVYVITNKLDQHPVPAKVALDEAFQPIGNAQMNSMWMQPVYSSPAAWNVRDSSSLPYSHQNIVNAMNQLYANELFNRQIARTNQNLSQKSRSASQSDDDKLVQVLAGEIFNKLKAASSKNTEPSEPVKIDEKKETSTSAPKTN